jgi:phage terminase small subunit
VDAIKPPRHLSRASKEIFVRLVRNYEMSNEPHTIRTLVLTLEASDRAEAARKVIHRDGPTFIDRFGQPKPRPEVAIERDARLAVFRGFRELALGGEDDGNAERQMLVEGL